MLFNSLHFLAFFLIVTLLFYAIPATYRWVVLLVASYAFYMSWKPEYAVLLASCTLVNYIGALLISSAKTERTRSLSLTASLTFSLGLLFYYKYFGFFATNANALLDLTGFSVRIPMLDILLPVGISFFTFQAIGYTVDVYWGLIQPERHFGKFALYVSFFPQLVAGPIEKASHLLPQFKQYSQTLSWHQFSSGASQFLWGLFKKVVLADTLAIYVDAVYSNQLHHSAPTLYVATVFFGFQVYCDFSGYSDMAIGAARILGYSLRENFKLPFFSQGIGEFWTRWHVSLYEWLRLYVYTPLSYSWMRYGLKGICAAAVLTFAISGIWHGAGWTYILFGVYHGFAVLIEAWWTRRRPKDPEATVRPLKYVRNSLIVFHVWLISLVLFRSPSLESALSFYAQGLSTLTGGLSILDANVFARICINVVVLFLVEFFILRKFSFSDLVKSHKLLLFVLAQVLIFCLISFGNSSGGQFIYFQF